MTNRLIHEKSPYLLQHAHNPVDWFPWGDEAFAKAKAENKPVLLSIGYSTCHWCHVMERECFENEAIAQLMNEHLVAIKLDREERPDIDAIYMKVAMMTSGHGGWPLNVFLTPDRRPFHAGTYYPPQPRGGMPSWPQVIQAVSEAWKNRQDEIGRAAGEITAHLKKSEAMNEHSVERTELNDAPIREGAEWFARAFDARHGGFGRAPKFPRPSVLTFLLRAASSGGAGSGGASKKNASANSLHLIGMVARTLDAMAQGGIHDQLGGGFHRYSTDSQWLTPHFEKMLYDQALLMQAYLEAWQLTGNEDYAAVCRDIAGYLLRDLTHPEGGFFCGEDADSEGVEGKFWVFTCNELRELLGEADGNLLARWFGASEEGNYEHATNILHRPIHLETFITAEKIEREEFLATLRRAHEVLFRHRESRVRPHRDDKILSGWNGLMIAQLARAGAALNEPRWIAAARKAAEFIQNKLSRDGKPLHTWRDGEGKIGAFLDDVAAMGGAWLELYQASFDPSCLARARALAQHLIQEFAAADGSFYDTANSAESLLVRPRESYDGAQPSGNALAANFLIRLGRLIGDETLTQAGESVVRAFLPRLNSDPTSLPEMAQALWLLTNPPMEIVVAGDPDSAEAHALLQEIRRRFLPAALLACRPDDPAARAAATHQIPALESQRPSTGPGAWIFVCANYSCQQPVNDLRELITVLN